MSFFTQILTFGVLLYVCFAIISIAQGAKDGGFRAGVRANPFPNDNSNPQILSVSAPPQRQQHQQDPSKFILTPEQQADYQRWLLEKQRHREVLQQQEEFHRQVAEGRANDTNASPKSSGTIPSFEDS